MIWCRVTNNSPYLSNARECLTISGGGGAALQSVYLFRPESSENIINPSTKLRILNNLGYRVRATGNLPEPWYFQHLPQAVPSQANDQQKQGSAGPGRHAGTDSFAVKYIICANTDFNHCSKRTASLLIGVRGIRLPSCRSEQAFANWCLNHWPPYQLPG